MNAPSDQKSMYIYSLSGETQDLAMAGATGALRLFIHSPMRNELDEYIQTWKKKYYRKKFVSKKNIEISSKKKEEVQLVWKMF